jgi:type I restriction enzyme S subunit
MTIATNIVLKELMPAKSGSVDPSKFPDETFDLYSIPAFDVGEPEVTCGRQIGSAKQTVQPGDVLLSRIVPHIRRAWVVGNNRGRRTIASGEWIIFRSNNFCPNYLRYLLIGEPFYARFLQTVAGVGGSLLRARPTQVGDIEVPMPPISEQQRIAAQLENTDRLRRTRRYALRICEELVPAAFLQFFGDIQQNSPKWLSAPLVANSQIASGVTKGQKYGGRPTIEVPYLRVANVQDGFLDLSEIKTIRALPKDVETLRLEAGDILMTEGGDFDKLGRGAIWRENINNCIHQNHIFRVRLNQSAILPKYFAAFLQSRFAKQYFLKCSKQTTNLASINMTQLRATPVLLPPLAIQQHFCTFIERQEQLRAIYIEALRQADHLFQTLLHEAFAN